MRNTDFDPIIAIATAPGTGGIGVIRVSFGRADPDALDQLMCQLSRPGVHLKPRHATYLPFYDAAGRMIDQGIALAFVGPHSFTGEHVLELQAHGGPVVLQMLLRRCVEIGVSINQQKGGLRLAEPGEFTRRAFLNDKLDLAQAEAVADLIEASTEQAVRSAQASLSGGFSSAVHELVAALVELRMLVEATLDFPEEEIEFLEKSDARGQLARVRARLESVFEQSRQGALLRTGMKVVLAGRPNVGKSSLLNALAKAEIAIVTPIAGTTRDKVTETIQIEGIPLHIIDTAGLRATEDEVERIGIARTWTEIERADVVLHLRDASEPNAPGDTEIIAELNRRVPARVPRREVYNKIDKLGSGDTPAAPARIDQSSPRHINVSARSGAGLDVLRAELLAIAEWHPGHGSGETLFLARERHLRALTAAAAHLKQAAAHAEQDDRVLDLFAEELRLAQEELNSITGEFSADDLLGEIFGRFCIGK